MFLISCNHTDNIEEILMRYKNLITVVTCVFIVITGMFPFALRPVEATEQKIPLTTQTAIDISKGIIRYEGSFVDNLLYGQPPLNPDNDDDNDGLKNKQELYTYTKNNKIYYGYNTHPKLEDTDGDGIIDSKDKNPLKWDISPRDMALFMELVYREDSYVNKVLDHKKDLTDIYEGRAEYKLMHKELAPFWKVEKFVHKDTGFDAAIFKTKSDMPYLPDNTVRVLAVRGTQGFVDANDDLYLALGSDIDQAGSMLETLREMNNESKVETYATGHSLGGYLVQRGMVDADKNGFNWLKKGYTFNAPKIKGNAFNQWLSKVSDWGDLLTRMERVVHYKVSNDKTIALIGNFKGAIDIGETSRGHSSRSYFESKINNIDGFTVGKRTDIDKEGYQQPNLLKQAFEKITDSKVYEPYLQVVDEEIFIGESANLIDNVKNKKDLPEGTIVEDVTNYNDVDFSKRGKHVGKIKIIYPDKSESIREVKINVRQKWSGMLVVPGSDTYTVVPEDVERFGKIDLTDNIKGLEQGSKIKVLTNDISSLHSGSFIGEVKITFKNGTSRIIKIPITVKPFKFEIKSEEIFENDPIDLTDNIVNKSSLPKDVIIEDVTDYTTVNKSKNGNYKGKLKLTYSDGQSEEIEIDIIVKQKPIKPNVPNIKGSVIVPIPPVSSLKVIEETVDHYGKVDLSNNVMGLPAGAHVEVVRNVSSDRVGDFIGRVKVVFANGASHLLDVPVKVRVVSSKPDYAPVEPQLPESPEVKPEVQPEVQPNVPDGDKNKLENNHKADQNDHKTQQEQKEKKTPEMKIPYVKKAEKNGFSKEVFVNNYVQKGEQIKLVAKQLPVTGVSLIIELITVVMFIVGICAVLISKKKLR